MRKIEERMVQAMKTGRTFSLGNTRVTALNGDAQSHVYLHGNLIARLSWVKRGVLLRARYHLIEIECTLAGWPTVTTRSRLNAICRGLGMACRFGQRKGRQYFDEQEIQANDWVTLNAKDGVPL